MSWRPPASIWVLSRARIRSPMPAWLPSASAACGGADGAELGELGLDAAGELGGFGVGPGEQQDVLAAQVVGEPHRGGTVAGGFVVGAADAAVPVVGGDRGQVAVAQADRWLAVPRPRRTGGPRAARAAGTSRARSRNIPPASTAPSWAVSPVAMIRAPACRAAS